MTAELTTALKQAEDAYHRLMTGRQAVEFRDSNGEMVRYTAPNARLLYGYILGLRQQLGIGSGSRPMGVTFG